jgi:putative ABC transport system ATP-binding protein
VIELREVRFAYGGAEDCLDIPELHVPGGEALFLHGPSGCGKSTLLSLIAGVLVARSGRVRVAGEDWSRLPRARRDAFRADHVGYLFQQFNLLPYLGAIDNVVLGCRFSRRRAARAAAQDGSVAASAERLLERVGIPAAARARAARELSVGQQQRVAAARALIGRPELLIADEPTSALDAAMRDGFVDLLLAECRAAGGTLVFVSHDRSLAARFDRVLSLPSVNRAAAAAAA